MLKPGSTQGVTSQATSVALARRPLSEGNLPPVEEVNRLVAKVVGWAIVILIVIWVISNPSRAGTDVHGWATAIVSFFSHLAGG
jgi:hypothetical protein